MWWHKDYIYRRHVSVFAPLEPIPRGHLVTLHLDSILFDYGKLREDLESIEVVYDGDNGLQPIYRSVKRDDEGDIYVSFQVQEFMDVDTVIDDKYKVYYGNLALRDQPTRPDPITTDFFFPDADLYAGEEVNTWPVGVDYKNQVTTSDGHGSISYTRPGEHWEEGVSNVRDARAHILLYATDLRIVSSTGPDKAIMEVRIDEGDWREVDLFRQNPREYESVYELHDLDEVLHEIQVRVSGRSNTSSLGDEVNIKGLEYARPVRATDLGEEVNEDAWITYFGGD